MERNYIMYCSVKYAKMYDDAIKERIKYELEMSKRRNKKAVVENPKLTEEQIKSVMELFKPSNFQLVCMKLFGLNGIFTGNKERVESLCSILKLNTVEIEALEVKYYLSK